MTFYTLKSRNDRNYLYFLGDTPVFLFTKIYIRLHIFTRYVICVWVGLRTEFPIFIHMWLVTMLLRRRREILHFEITESIKNGLI